MNSVIKKISILLMLVLSVQTFMFSASEKDDDPETMNLVLLNKEVIALKFELYQIEHKYGKYEDMNAIKTKIEKTKIEKKLKRFEQVLERRNAENKEEAKIAAQKAYEELKPGLKDFAEKSKSLGKELGDKLSNFIQSIKENK